MTPVLRCDSRCCGCVTAYAEVMRYNHRCFASLSMTTCEAIRAGGVTGNLSSAKLCLVKGGHRSSPAPAPQGGKSRRHVKAPERRSGSFGNPVAEQAVFTAAGPRNAPTLPAAEAVIFC